MTVSRKKAVTTIGNCLLRVWSKNGMTLCAVQFFQYGVTRGLVQIISVEGDCNPAGKVTFIKRALILIQVSSN